MITYSQIQDIAGDVEFVGTMLEATNKIDDPGGWWYESSGLERELFAKKLKLAAEILNHLTIEQVEALPSYLRAA